MMIETFEKNTDLVVLQFNQLTEFEFGLDEKSLKWISGFINRQRESDDFDDETGNTLVSTIGCYFGQCIIKHYGGEWQSTEHGWAIDFGGGNMVLPFNKTAKQFLHGADESIYALYKSIPAAFLTSQDQAEKVQKPNFWQKLKRKWG